MKPEARALRRVNGFAIFQHGRLIEQSIRRWKSDCLDWVKAEAREARHPLWLDQPRWCWDEHAPGAGLVLRVVQVLVLEEVGARHGNTGRKKSPHKQ